MDEYTKNEVKIFINLVFYTVLNKLTTMQQYFNFEF